jgi:hypothetical protein
MNKQNSDTGKGIKIKIKTKKKLWNDPEQDSSAMYWKYKKTGKRQQIFTMENNLN